MRALHQLHGEQELDGANQQTTQIQRQSQRTQSQRNFIDDDILLGRNNRQLFGPQKFSDITGSDGRDLQ